MQNIFLVIFLFISSAASSVSYAGNFSTELDLSTGYNDNVFLAGEDELLSSEDADSTSEDVLTRFGLGSSYEFLDGRNSDGSIYLDLYNEHLIDNDISTTMTALGTPFNFYHGNYKLKLQPGYSHYNISGEDAMDYLSVLTDVTYKLTGRHHIGMALKNTDKHALSDNYASYEGSEIDFYSHYTWRGDGKRFYAKLGLYENDYDEALDSDWSNKTSYAQVKYRWLFGRHSNSLGINYKDIDYLADSFEDTGVQRQDDQVRLSYSYDYQFNRSANVYFQTEYVENDSNISNDIEEFSYTQWVHSAGIRWLFD